MPTAALPRHGAPQMDSEVGVGFNQPIGPRSHEAVPLVHRWDTTGPARGQEAWCVPPSAGGALPGSHVPWLAGGEGHRRLNSPGCRGQGEWTILPLRGCFQLPHWRGRLHCLGLACAPCEAGALEPELFLAWHAAPGVQLLSCLLVWSQRCAPSTLAHPTQRTEQSSLTA